MNDEINLHLHTPGMATKRYVVSKEKIQGIFSGGDSVAAAVAESRCINPPIGCGKPIQVDRVTKEYWPNEAYQREWRITGLCAPCQDRVEAAMAEMYGDQE